MPPCGEQRASTQSVTKQPRRVSFMCAYACAEFPSDLTSSTRGDAANEAEVPRASRDHEPRPSMSPNFPRSPFLGMVAADESRNFIEVPRVILLSPHRWRSASKAMCETSMSQSSGHQKEACDVQASSHETGGNKVPCVTPRETSRHLETPRDTLMQQRVATDMVALALDFRELERKGKVAEAAAVAAAAAAAAEKAAIVSDTTWQERERRKAIVWHGFVQHSLEALK